jgi:hypothetical protein
MLLTPLSLLLTGNNFRDTEYYDTAKHGSTILVSP